MIKRTEREGPSGAIKETSVLELGSEAALIFLGLEITGNFKPITVTKTKIVMESVLEDCMYSTYATYEGKGAEMAKLVKKVRIANAILA